ncbi:allyl alcohol dehydrogenase, partial [Neoconidiobolus thromboides FSU 785]
LVQDQLLVRNLYASVDPYMRGRMRPSEVESYFQGFQLNKPLNGGIVSEVITSKSDKFKKGDIVVAFGDWSEYAIVSAARTNLIPNGRESKVPLTYYLGITGMPGATAYVGLHTICEPIKQGETIFISAASGAVGQVVGQYCKQLGLRVVGSAGSDDKVEYLLKELNFDAAFNYKKYDDLVPVLKEHCPNGIDIYFENVGGKTLEAVLEVANDKCHIPACGMISQYNKGKESDGIHNLTQIIGKRIRIEGFIVNDRLDLFPKAFETFGKYLAEGKMKYKEHLTEGVENLPTAFIDML